MDDKLIIEQAKKVLTIEANAVETLIDRIDDSFVRAVEVINSCQGRVVVTGMGKSGLIGKKISATLASTGTPSLFLHPAEGSHGDLGMVARGDVVIALSASGETNEIISIIPILKRLGVTIIALTGNKSSVLAQSSDVILDISVKEEACPLGIAPTASTTATLAMGDALAVALINKKGFKKEDFAFFHPGGTLGKRLLLTVSNLMLTGDAVPVVDSDVVMKEAIIEISSKRLGMTTVIDSSQILKGVITDGDLRRGLEKWGAEFFLLRASEVMTKNPKTVSSDCMAVQALNTMEKYSITSLVIIKEDNKVVGVVHLHDILKAGIV
jgi:arabinose-5-phosphate isomerase